MGASCSRPPSLKRAPEDSLEHLRHKYAACRRARVCAEVPSLLQLSVERLAGSPQVLSEASVARLSDGLAQLLMDVLIESGKLDEQLLGCFSGTHVWRLALGGYPGVHSGWIFGLGCASLLDVNLRETEVCMGCGPCALQTRSRHLHCRV